MQNRRLDAVRKGRETGYGKMPIFTTGRKIMISLQTNVASMVAQENLQTNTNFQNQTIEELTSGYRINSAGDDPAGLAVANDLRNNVTELTQGVLNANDGEGQLQIIDGGLTNIGNILDRLKTLATESASTTFTGTRATVNNEYQSLLGEIDRQAANVGLSSQPGAGSQYNQNLSVYIGGGSTQDNAKVGVDLSGTQNQVDSAGLQLSGTSVLGGGTSFANNTTNLSDTMATFDVGAPGGANYEAFKISYVSNGTAQQQTVDVNAQTSGYTGANFVTALNNAITNQGITGVTAQIGSNGDLQFVGAGDFTVSHSVTGTVSAPSVLGSATQNLTNSANYNVSKAFTAFNMTDQNGGPDTPVVYQSETATFTTGGQNYAVTLNANPADTAHYAGNINQAVSAINQQLQGSGISAILDQSGNISFQGSNSFTIAESATAGTWSGSDSGDTSTGSLFGASGNVAVTAPSTNGSATGDALSALTAINNAVAKLGVVQGSVGAGENQLNYAISLAQSQITNFSSADSQIRDADVAAEAANLTKAQVLQQASIAAMAQANAAPQQILTLLRG